MKFNILRNRKKTTEEVVEFSLKELLHTQQKLIREGKLNGERIMNTDFSPELDYFYVERDNYMIKIQQDLVTVKKALAEGNIATSNHINIIEYEAKKVMLSILEKSGIATNQRLSKLLKYNKRIKTLKSQMSKLSKKMNEINDGYKVKVKLISGVIERK